MRRYALALCAALALSIGLPSRAAAFEVVASWGVGNEPFGVTVDARDGSVYVAISNSKNSSGPENVYVVQPAVPPGPFPMTISLPATQVMSVLDAELDRLFVSLANGSLAIVDVRSRALVATVPNAALLGLALDRATHEVYSALGIGGLAMVDGATGAVLHRAGTSGDAYWGVAHDPARHRVYVTNLGSVPGVVAYDDRDLTEVGRVALPEIPRLGIAVDLARGLVYVPGYSTGTGAAAGHLYAVDGSTLATTQTLDVGLGRTAALSATLDAASDRLYLSNVSSFGFDGGELVTVDLATFTVSDRTSLAFQPGQLALHPDGRLYVAGFSSDSLVALGVKPNSAPVIDAVSVDPSTPRTNDTVRAVVSAHDAEGDALTYTYRWSRNGVVLTGETGATLDLSKPGNGDKGDQMTLEVTASDGQLASAPASLSFSVANSAPTVVVSLNTKTPGKHDVVTATASGTDADGDALTYTYTWTLRGIVVRATTTSVTTDSFDLRGSDAKFGDTLTVGVVAADSAASSASASETATVTRASS
jgi:DNA-binding beta-propeller fold protein YncE